MDYKTKDAILREAEKLTDEFINIVWKQDEAGEYTLCAVAFMDGCGRIEDYMTDFYTPSGLLAHLKEQNAENEKAAAMFPDKGTEYQAELIAANID